MEEQNITTKAELLGVKRVTKKLDRYQMSSARKALRDSRKLRDVIESSNDKLSGVIEQLEFAGLKKEASDLKLTQKKINREIRGIVNAILAARKVVEGK